MYRSIARLWRVAGIAAAASVILAFGMASANAQVADANIQLTPPTATNRIGSNHALTCHVNVNDGAGFTNAPAGTICTGSILSGPSSFVGPNQCTTVGTTGDCQLTITSATTGQTMIRASTNVVVGGVAVSRATGDAQPGDSPDAQKTWVNAAIVIAPNATNEVGQPHTFTATVLFDTGAGLQPASAGQPVTMTLTPSNGAAALPAGPFNLVTNASGQIMVSFSSLTAGQITGSASWTGSVGASVPFTVTTDGVAPNSGAAVKTFVDANIQITPSGQNQLGQPHVFTGHVNVNAGTGAGFVNAPDGTLISFTIDSGPGSFTTPNTCPATGGTGSCQVTLVSAVAGTTIVSAHTIVAVGGVALPRNTDGTGANSGPATKIWVPTVAPPTLVKAFGAPIIALSGTTSVTFTIGNPNAVSLSGITFTDTLPAGLVVATPNGVAGSCSAGSSLAAVGLSGSGTISVTSGTLAAGGSCTLSFNVLGIAAGTQVNTIATITSIEGGNGGPASATVVVVAPPTISKSFSPSTITAGGTSTLTFTIANPAANAVALTGVGVTDILPSGISVSGSTASVCGGTLTTSAPSTITLAGASVAVNGSCQFSVAVLGPSNGTFDNVSGNVTFDGGTGGSAAATLIVLAPRAIPTLGLWALGLLALALVATAATGMGRRQRAGRG